MKTLYLDAFSGISGNMFLGALFDAGLNFEDWKKELGRLNIRNFNVCLEHVTKNSVHAKHFVVEAQEEAVARHLSDIQQIIGSSSLSQKIKENAIAIFTNLAKAEAKVHGCSVQDVHFHEVGAIDAIVDIVGVAIALEILGIDELICSPIRVGYGMAKMAHGSMPIPAPATALLLTGVPTFAGDVEGEFATPTGAAIIKTLCKRFQSQPVMTIEHVGAGAGTRDYPHPNILRAFIGRSENSINADTIWVLETDIDDLKPEICAYVQEHLLSAGALDVTLTSIIMKKGRPGVRLTVLSKLEDKEKIVQILFEETSTLGIRETLTHRRKLNPTFNSVQTQYGPIQVKIASRYNNNELTAAPEYEDCKKIALAKKVPLQEIYRQVELQFLKQQSGKGEK